MQGEVVMVVVGPRRQERGGRWHKNTPAKGMRQRKGVKGGTKPFEGIASQEPCILWC